MKKFIGILCLFVLFTTNNNAQDAKGNFSFDLNFDPAALFDANAGPMFYMPYIKARYFIAPDLAARIGLGFGFGSETIYLDIDGNDYTKETQSEITFAPGIEKHFGSNKFFAYVGGAIPITNYSHNGSGEFAGESYEVKNPDGDAYMGLGLQLICGADFYLLENFYIGAELAPGLLYTKYKDTEDQNGDVVEKGGKQTTFSLAASSGIRIGVRF